MTGVLRQRGNAEAEPPTEKMLAIRESEAEASPGHFSQPPEGPALQVLDRGLWPPECETIRPCCLTEVPPRVRHVLTQIRN